MSKTIGILGGLGPAATIDLFQKIVANTKASVDQDHLRIIIYNNPKIPPRKLYTDQIKTDSLIQELITSAKLLENAGADFIVMPCHTAHIWFEQITKTINIPFYSLIENTVEAVIEENEQFTNSQKKILLLSTSTTASSKLYQNGFKNTSINLIIPKIEEQKIIDKLILNIKSDTFATSEDLTALNQLLIDYKSIGVSSILGGCTEIPLIFQYININLEMIDPTLLLALACIKKAQN